MIKMGSMVKMNDKYFVSENNRDKIFKVVSCPWNLCGTMVVKLEGFGGCYALDGLSEVQTDRKENTDAGNMD